MRNILLYLLLFIFCKTSIAQTYLEPIVGYAADAREKQNLSMINTGLQVSLAKKSGFEFSMGVIHGFGIKRNGSDSSFTLNPSLPVYSNAAKTVQAEFSGIFTNYRFKLFKTGINQYINFNFITGIRLQRVLVNYRLSHPDYIVLNPETNYKRFGLYVGAGLEYVYVLENGRIIFQSNILNPSVRRRKEKINSFNQHVPLNFNIMYSIKLKNKQ